jgi:NAD-specific glutamate dehydrogenase
VPALTRLIDVLEESGDLDRKTEGLAPSDDYARRAAGGAGLTRPELAVLVSSAKLVLQRALEDSPVVDDPVLEEELLAAFPPRCARRSKATSCTIACAARSSRPSWPTASSTASARSIRSNWPRKKG